MILKYDQTKYKIDTNHLEEAIKRIKEGNKYINKLENEILYYKIKINKVIEYIENEYDFYYGDELKDEYQKIIDILKGSDK